MKNVIWLLFAVTFIVNAQQFTKVTTGIVVTDGGDSRSVNWVDYDNDGTLDLFITNGPGARANNFLYKNNGNGTFTKITNASVVNDPGSYDGASWADYDNDGFLDVFSVTWYGQKNSLHRQRNGAFEKVVGSKIAPENTYSETASWADYNNDGFVDLYITNSAVSLANILYKNNGDGTFTKVTSGSLVTDAVPSRSADWCDFDNDGKIDLFVGNESNSNNSLYWNNGDGTFTSMTTGPVVSDGGNSFGSSVGDINNDGFYDIFVANNGNQNNFLYINNGNRTFTKVTTGPVVSDNGYSVGSVFGDVDNDGDVDLIVTNAFSGSTQTKNFYYLNNGKGEFTKVDSSVIVTDMGWSYGVAMGDYDRDGDLDVAMANCFGANQNNALYNNSGNGNSWLTLQLAGKVSNYSAIGSKVKVKATVNGNSVWQHRFVSGQSGYCGQNLELHFGLGNATTIDSLVIEWPSGQTTVQTNVSTKQHLKITEHLPDNFFRGAIQIGTFEEMAPMLIEFKDISTISAASPANFWQWDFNEDGIVDATTSTASFQYAAADTYSVRLVVGNGITTDTITSTNSIIISPSASIIQFSTAIHNFGTVDVNVPVKDTTMYIYNTGKLADSISVTLIYGSSTAGTIKPDSALFIEPKLFVLAPKDSHAIKYSVYPPKVIRTNLNITYTPRIVVTSKHNAGAKVFEKTMWIKLQGTLLDVSDAAQIPKQFALQQNYPNPFNPETKIAYQLPADGIVAIKVFDLLGREIRTLVNEFQSAGSYQTTFHAQDLSSGIYYYSITSNNYSDVKKMILLK